MAEFEVGDHTYQSGRLDCFKQVAVARRLGPLVTGFVDALAALKSGNADGVSSVQPVLDAIGKLSDDDANFVLNTCLAVVSRRDSGSWATILPAPGNLVFSDITPSQMLSIVSKVLEAHQIAAFFSDLLSVSALSRLTGEVLSASETAKIG